MHTIKMIALVLIAFAVVQLSNQQTFEQAIAVYLQLLEPAESDCIKESGADLDAIHKEVKLGEFSEDQNSKCFWKCFLRKRNAINDNDEIEEENIKPLVGVPDKKLADEIHKKCVSIKGSDLCDTSFKILTCIYLTAKAALA